MKTILQTLLYLSIMLFSFNIYGQSPPEIVYDDSEIGILLTDQIYKDNYENEVIIQLDSHYLDLNELLVISELTLGVTYEVTINFSNTLNDIAIIKAVINPCSCTSVDWYKGSISAGSTGFIKIKYTATILGESQKRFTAVFYDTQGLKPLGKKDIVLNTKVAAPALTDHY